MARRTPGRQRQFSGESKTIGVLLPPDIQAFLRVRAAEGQYSVAAAVREVLWAAMREESR